MKFSYVVRCGLGTAMSMWRLWEESGDCVCPESQQWDGAECNLMEAALLSHVKTSVLFSKMK